MIKKSKKIIASLLMTLSLISIFPMTKAFAYNVSEDVKFFNTCTKVNWGGDRSIYEKDGKYYGLITINMATAVARSEFFGDYYAQSDGTLVKDTWIYGKYQEGQKDGYYWKYFGSDYKCLKGYQTMNGIKYFFSNEGGDKGELQIGWFYNHCKWCYSYPDGSIHEGWVKGSDGYWYYVDSDGMMARNTTTPDGYVVDRLGRWK